MRRQLYSRKTRLASKGELSRGTTIKIPLHEPGVIPEKIDFMRFLATSITFMARLETVEVFLDRDCLGSIKKIPGCTETVPPPISLPHSSPSEMMTVHQLQCHRRYHLSCEIHNLTLVLDQNSRSKPRSRPRFGNRYQRKYRNLPGSVRFRQHVKHNLSPTISLLLRPPAISM